MSFQIGTLVEGTITDWTFVRRFFHVQNLVYGQGAGLAEPFATFRALERLLLGVYVSVRMRINKNRKKNGKRMVL